MTDDLPKIWKFGEIIEEGWLSSPIGHCSESWILQMKARGLRGPAQSSYQLLPYTLLPSTESSHLPHGSIVGISNIASYEIILYAAFVAMTIKRDSWGTKFNIFIGMEQGLGTENKFLSFSELTW